MKYMTFNSSCSYAGVANMLESYNIDVEDRQIALEIDLPYMFSRENGIYCSGPMLQSAEWFNLYLKPRGFRMTETRLSRDEVCSFLSKSRTAMLGLALTSHGRHAVVYIGTENGCCRFLNNKHKDSPEPEVICLTPEELLPLLGDTVVAAVLQECRPQTIDITPYLQSSADILLQLKQDITAFCLREQPPQALRAARNTLFRAILLDAVTMLELSGNEEPLTALRAVQKEFLAMLKENKPLVPADHLSLNRLEKAMDTYRELIKARCKRH
ncbi:MAG: hypothetical protein NC517_01370 [Firmicutes bacterium]|nr:hypothetical protein [Bacillota bacterium]